jgi:hypothetical protein
MYSGVPNLISVFGYTNASWTLKCDLTCEYTCNLLNWMGDNGYDAATPVNTDPTVTETPWLDFSSGYVQRTIDRFPKQGSKAPWKLHQNYYIVQNQLIEQTLEWEHRATVCEHPRPYSPHTPQYANLPPPPTELSRQ